MTTSAAGPGDKGTQDGEILADLFDTLLQEILEGNTPDLAIYLPDRPDLRDRIARTWALACSVAGRREPSRPVLGGYEIVRELGHGGMGTVYLARHQTLQRDVAIKVLPHSLAMSPRAKQRFLEEARALAQLRHDHVVRIHRIIDHAEMLAFEMEYVDGPSLQKVVLGLRQQPRPHSIEALSAVLSLTPEQLGTRSSVEWFVRVGIRIARALGEVHRHGLVHRDVKPSNILVRGDGRPVLADFGLARLPDLDATQTGGFAGTPVYAAPERLRGSDGEVDARADVYSLGVSLYEALTLNPPFAGSTTHEVLRRIEAGSLPALRQQAPHVSRDLETVLGKAMESDLRHRYADADAFADDLERLLSLQPIQARPAGPVRAAVKFVRRHQRVVVAALAGAVMVAGFTWPVLAHASAAEASQQLAAKATHEARAQLLALESLQSVARRTFAGRGSQPLQQPTAAAAQTRSLAAALQRYDEALAAAPAATEARLERDVVAFALACRGAAAEEVGASGLQQALQPLPPLAQRLARAIAGRTDVDEVRQYVDTSAPRDRFAAGLLAFLVGDLAISHACWRGLDRELADHPLLDACTALQLTSDGFPERAYPRLFHAARAFPGASSLALAMADSALAMGDLPLAEHWLTAVPDDADEPAAHGRRWLLRADLLAARHDLDGAARAYRELARTDPTDPTPLLRLASVAQAQGDHDRSERLLQSLLLRWPDLAAARLAAARHALLRHDLPGYVAQARHALTQDLQTCPREAAAQFAEVLELGGLYDLLPKGPGEEPLRSRPITHATTLPLSAWLPPARLAAVRRGLTVARTFDRCAAEAERRDARPIGAALRCGWLAALRLPDLSLRLPLPLQAALFGGLPPLLGTPTDFASALLMPYARTLDTPMHVVRETSLLHTTTDLSKVIFGTDLAVARDVDGDSLPDLCIATTARGADGALGHVDIHSLPDGSPLRRFGSEDDAHLFARSVAVLDDIDGDLCDDILIGQPTLRLQEVPTGAVELRSGRTGAVLWRVDHAPFAFGVALARLPDLDGDGKDDFVVGGAGNSLTSGERGRAFVGSGASGRLLRELVADRSGTWFGSKVADAGDVDGDGQNDVLVGGNYGSAPGLVMLFSGASGAPLLTFADDVGWTDYGASIAGIGDVDADRVPDFAIAAPGLSSRGRDRGKVQIVSGGTGKVVVELFGDRAGDGFGIALCAVQDWLPRSGPSLVVAARRGGPIGTGYVRTFSARNGQPQQTFAGGPAVVAFGHSLADAGDLDGDGYPEVLLPVLLRDGTSLIWRMSFPQTKAGAR